MELAEVLKSALVEKIFLKNRDDLIGKDEKYYFARE